MAVETVRVYATDESANALDGVLVRFFDAGDSFVTQQYTSIVGNDAYAEVSLDGDDPPTSYTIRLSKTGVAFDGSLGDDSKTPQSIAVYSPETAAPNGNNYFNVQGQTFSLPTAPDPRLCRCSGYFVDMQGQPLKNFNVHIAAINPSSNVDGQEFSPLIVDGLGVMKDKLLLRSDDRGYMTVDLFREGCYNVLVQGFEQSRRIIVVPDLSAINLIDLLFPVVSEVTFTPNPATVAAGSYTDVTLTVKASDGQTLDPADQDVTFTTGDETVATVQVVDGNLRVMGIAAGTTQITAARSDDSIVSIPSQPVTYTPLDVTVT